MSKKTSSHISPLSQQPPSVQENLFDEEQRRRINATTPLSERMRPQSLEEFVGQRHILYPGSLLQRAIEADRLSSLILYGPPGVGKTSLAMCIRRRTQATFERLNAVAASVADLRHVLHEAKQRRLHSGRRTLLFIDEIHRFNKAQQDVLMPEVEDGTIVLIGATVFNPFFSLVSPLLSRSLVFELKPLNEDEVAVLIQRAVKDPQRGLGHMPLNVTDEAVRFWARMCEGDARRALNALEIAALTTPADREGRIVIGLDEAAASIQKKPVLYDRSGDEHYDTISAYIKSLRGSDPDAAVYWLAKMLYAGEDPRFIARRLVIAASEDVGNADPQALVLAVSAFEAVERVGMPEARIILSQATIYVACAPKSNASYLAVESALSDVEHDRVQPVPVHLKDKSYPGAKRLGHGEGYRYAHAYPGHFVDQDYLSVPVRYYEPTNQGYEQKITQRLNAWRQRKKGTEIALDENNEKKTKKKRQGSEKNSQQQDPSRPDCDIT